MTKNQNTEKKPLYFVNSSSNLSDFFLIVFFITSIFETLYFLKACPIFDELSAVEFTKYGGFL